MIDILFLAIGILALGTGAVIAAHKRWIILATCLLTVTCAATVALYYTITELQ